MRDVDIITKALGEAHLVLLVYVHEILHGCVKPGSHDTDATVQQLLDIIARNDVIAARERLSKGNGKLREVE
jgi:hypothetical protein